MRWPENDSLHKDLRNPEYVEYRRFLMDAEGWDRQRIEEWTLESLRRVVSLAWDTAGYRRLYQSVGLSDPADVRSLEDFRRLPTVTKEDLRDDVAAFTVPMEGAKYTATGGSTGIPFGFYYDAKAFSRTLAARAHQYARRGWKEGDRQFVLRGASAGSGEKKISSPDHMEFDAALCELRASALYLDEADIDRYLARAWEYRPEWLRVYPSAGTLLARHLRETGKKFPLVKGVLSSAENLYPYQKQIMEDAFGARVFSHYGHMELSALAGMCEHSDSYHVLPFYGHVELLDKDGRNIAAVGESGEITATSFIMNATLFVRYRTRDFAVLEGEKCPLCGRPYPCWSSVEGRLQEYAVTASGRLLAMTSINMYDDVFEPIKQFQFRQKEAGKLVFAYIPKESQCTREVVMRMRDSIADKFDNDMDVECLAVDDIPMTGRGKHRFLVQELEITHGDA